MNRPKLSRKLPAHEFLNYMKNLDDITRTKLYTEYTV